ncbi:hypothetical protein CLAFUW4_06057 [Fulvia fulva]|uniref:Uncharacterized protein n=1 Tax=Passalora fulva TaxID=5499 RepID=A0A9Q8P987_PASFU|nr:uncharacterized protein CLAFUR5_06201 [Fulvia fulva]KAK4624375.1 hypothetical protein CLAFUR4_06061 [Fulvia fulva]KAK4624975.1 hypothetical protein CLAFUR0_06065 [Fulvia fulva]UJO18030.1 hypothetical protein CLAFUR5_06201 [Fulvia fulva]WPV14632.1 hypothetical protein CLAFUW4_06057 [Fulvia fulva]WPV30470.1 hypothetical protein CLAFUW7_06054 [Fulvia fulva]
MDRLAKVDQTLRDNRALSTVVTENPIIRTYLDKARTAASDGKKVEFDDAIDKYHQMLSFTKPDYRIP